MRSFILGLLILAGSAALGYYLDTYTSTPAPLFWLLGCVTGMITTGIVCIRLLSSIGKELEKCR